MRKLSFLFFGLLTGCSFLSVYTITFTTLDGASVDPAVNTLDFVVNAPVLAYLSEVDCEGTEDIVLLPVVTESMQVKTAYNLSLAALAGQAPGSECDLTVTAFDQTTTATAQASIEVVIAGEQVVIEPSESAVVSPTAEATPVEEAATQASEDSVEEGASVQEEPAPVVEGEVSTEATPETEEAAVESSETPAE